MLLATLATNAPASTIMRRSAYVPSSGLDGSSPIEALLAVGTGDRIPADVAAAFRATSRELYEYLFFHLDMTADLKLFLTELDALAKNCAEPYREGGALAGCDVPPMPPRAPCDCGSSACDKCLFGNLGREAAFFASGFFFGQGAAGWQSSVWGGSDVKRPERRYNSATEVPGCSKAAPSVRGLTNGIMVYSCGLCRCIVGFHALDKPEGTLAVFSSLYTRFEEAPDIIVYDNGCNLANSCVMREPEFFESSDFYVDAFHHESHACHPGMSSKRGKVKNSPLQEQKNKSIDKVTTQMSYMAQVTYLWFIRHFLYMMNVQELAKSPGPRR